LTFSFTRAPPTESAGSEPAAVIGVAPLVVRNGLFEPQAENCLAGAPLSVSVILAAPAGGEDVGEYG